jgi:membrane fusion protein (multidrug efflux system)
MADADPAFETGAIDNEPATPPRARRLRGRIIMFGLPLLVLLGGGYYWYSLQGKVSTDNAYLRQEKVSVGAEVSGPITQILVKSGQDVTEGQVLFRIDPRPFELQVAQANAAIASAQANVTALSNSADFTGVDISAAREEIAFAQATLARQQALWRRGFVTKADYEAAQHTVSQAQEKLRQAQADQQEARAKLATGAAVPGVDPRIAAAMAQRQSAMLNLSRTTVRAPKSGRVAQAERLQTGQQVITGLPVLTIVANKQSYVEANFKETDLDEMKVGQPAKITFDAYPDLELKGHVAYLGAGTGSEFSVIPAQNATGNWVKVTQRVPVRIAIDEKSPRLLIAGLSTHVTVYTDGRKR